MKRPVYPEFLVHNVPGAGAVLSVFQTWLCMTHRVDEINCKKYRSLNVIL
jgi:hypothetical protein